MGERAKVTINEYTALSLLKRKDLDLDKFYSSDLKILGKVDKKEIKKLSNIINEIERDLNQHIYYGVSSISLIETVHKLERLKENKYDD